MRIPQSRRVVWICWKTEWDGEMSNAQFLSLQHTFIVWIFVRCTLYCNNNVKEYLVFDMEIWKYKKKEDNKRADKDDQVVSTILNNLGAMQYSCIIHLFPFAFLPMRSSKVPSSAWLGERLSGRLAATTQCDTQKPNTNNHECKPQPQPQLWNDWKRHCRRRLARGDEGTVCARCCRSASV